VASCLEAFHEKNLTQVCRVTDELDYNCIVEPRRLGDHLVQQEDKTVRELGCPSIFRRSPSQAVDAEDNAFRVLGPVLDGNCISSHHTSMSGNRVCTE